MLQEPDESGLLERLLGSDIELSWGDDIPADTEVLVGGRPPEEVIGRLRRLDALVIPYAGVPQATRELMRQHTGVKVYNLHHNAAPTAELAMALFLSSAKRILDYALAMKENDWSARYKKSSSMLVEGKRALVLGYGEIGRRIARACVGLGMEVGAIKRTVRRAYDGEVEMTAMTGLRSCLAKADVIFVALPLTDETEGLLRREELECLKPGAMLINIARGPIIDEDALYALAKKGRFSGLGLDVWWSYPKNAREAKEHQGGENDWSQIPGAVLTPHIGGSVAETEELRMQGLADLLNRLAKRDPQLKKVDLDLGY